MLFLCVVFEMFSLLLAQYHVLRLRLEEGLGLLLVLFFLVFWLFFLAFGFN